MTAPGALEDICRYFLEYEEGRYTDDPVRLGLIFQEYIGIRRTPSLGRTVNLVRSLGIEIEAVDYLNTGGTNMNAKGSWHIHYSAKDRPATQKFDILHELYEVIYKSFVSLDPAFDSPEEPQLSRNAERFAASALIPPGFFLRKAGTTGCDLVKLGEDLELSHQCLLIALGQHFTEIAFVGALYEHSSGAAMPAATKVEDFRATVVVKTARARRIRSLCGLQTVPARNSHPQAGSLVCAAITGARPLLWESTHIEDSPAILVRPLVSAGLEPYRVILLAIPKEERSMILPQVERIQPVPVNGDMSCPWENKCRISENCRWRSIGDYYEQ